MGEAKRRAARGEIPAQTGGHYDRDADVRKLASAMDERVRQLEASTTDISDRDLMEQMLGFLPSLHQLWTSTSDDTLANLCSEYPGFYRYAQVMEDAFEAQRKNPGADPVAAAAEPLPDSVQPIVIRLMGDAATLERELRNAVDAAQRNVALGKHVDPSALQAETARARGIESLHRNWVAGLAQLGDEIQAANVPHAATQVLAKAFGDMNERIGKLNDRLLTLVLAGRANARSGFGGSVN